jgi:uncharacterized lipoprotein YajG
MCKFDLLIVKLTKQTSNERNQMDMTTYIERDNESRENNEMLENDDANLNFSGEHRATNKDIDKLLNTQKEDVFTRRRERGAFAYFPSAIF